MTKSKWLLDTPMLLLYKLNVKIIVSGKTRLLVQTDYFARMFTQKWKAALNRFTILPEGRMSQRHRSVYIKFKITFVAF